MANTVDMDSMALASGNRTIAIEFGSSMVEACTRALRGEITHVLLDGALVAEIVPPGTTGSHRD